MCEGCGGAADEDADESWTGLAEGFLAGCGAEDPGAVILPFSRLILFPLYHVMVMLLDIHECDGICLATLFRDVSVPELALCQ